MSGSWDHTARVWEAATGGEALKLASKNPSLVLLDVNLPDTDGFQICRQIKKNPETASLPILMISGLAVDLKDRVQGLEGGADAYLTKPVEPEELVAYIRTLLRVRQVEEKAIAAQRRRNGSGNGFAPSWMPSRPASRSRHAMAPSWR